MAVIRWTGKEFKIAGPLLDRDSFEAWLAQDGRTVLEEALRKTRVKWLLGRHRARWRIHRDARAALRPGDAFGRALKTRVDQLPEVLRKTGIQIKRRGHKDLYSASSTVALVTVPRAVLQNEFSLFLLEHLAAFRTLVRFRGLARRIVHASALAAEQSFFEAIRRGQQHIHPNGRTMVLGVEPDYRWPLNDVRGHYYCGYTGKSEKDLTKRRDLKKFRAEMEEVLYGQRVYLKRLRTEEIAVVSDRFRARQGVLQ